ncbi:MAG: TerB family tellurite resistance protein [Polyangiaceae bacterium]|nr:TerB family tellurite resistance protein [Polyangiaceae bacterium]
MSLSIFLLPLAVVATLAVLGVLIGSALIQWVRAQIAVGHVDFHIDKDVLAPGEGTRVVANVVSRSQPLGIRAKLVCTMFDHRARRIYESTHDLAAVVGQQHVYASFLRLPAYALRTGTVGTELSSFFSEEAHRLFVSWTAELEISPRDAPGDVLVHRTIAIDVPEGRLLAPDREAMDRVILESCQAMHSDLVFNWLVHMAAADGSIAPSEQALLRDVLRTAHGVSDPVLADQRILVEMSRRLEVDPVALRKHVPVEALRSFYRFLFAMAWRDGQLDGREHNMLIDALDKFGLDGAMVHDIEVEVLGGFARW